MLYIRDLVKISHLTKTSVRLCFWRLVGWPYLSETFLMWSNTGRGCNFRCGELFLSETILITPPPCNSQSILAISRTNALNLWWAHTHIDTQRPTHGFMHCLFGLFDLFSLVATRIIKIWSENEVWRTRAGARAHTHTHTRTQTHIWV